MEFEVRVFVLLLYNDCWHGLWVHSWWPRVLWQAVTLWLVNRGMAVRRSRLVEQMCNRKETIWYDNHAVRFRQSVQERIESQARDMQPIRGVSVVSDDMACKGVQAFVPPTSRKKIWGKKKSPLWAYVSSSISQTYNKLWAPFEDEMRARSVFCFVNWSVMKWEMRSVFCFVNWISSIIFDYLVDESIKGYTTLLDWLPYQG